MEFNYKAVNKDGDIVEGTLEASDQYEVGRTLKSQELTAIRTERTDQIDWKGKIKRILSFGSISTHEKIIFGRNLSAMIEAGLSMTRALSVMERQGNNKKLKTVLNKITDDIKKGDSLSDALKKFPKIFSQLFISMVKAGEESGNLVQSLEVVSTQMENTYLLKKKIRGALIYPGVILSAMILIGIFMLLFIVPTLVDTFKELDVELPATTQFVISLSDFLSNNILLALMIIIITISLFIFGIKTERGKRTFDTVLLYTPLIKGLTKETNAARTARTLASLLSSGVSYVESIKITRDVVQNSYYKNILDKAEKNVELGLPISKIFLEEEKFYPVFVGEMIAVGEETGELSKMLLKVADFYEEEVSQKTKNMSTIVEPFLMIVVGIAVGFFAISMISPMYGLVDAI